MKLLRRTNKFWSSQEYVIEIKLPDYIGRINKRYNDFSAFNEALLTKFKNLEFPDFPSRFQLLNKKETRIEKFSELFKRILEYASKYPELKERLLNMLYTFLVASCKTIQSNLSQSNLSPGDKSQKSKRKKLLNLLSKGFKFRNKNKDEKKRRKSVDLSSSTKQILTEEEEMMLGSRNSKFLRGSIYGRSNKGIDDIDKMIYEFQRGENPFKEVTPCKALNPFDNIGDQGSEENIQFNPDEAPTIDVLDKEHGEHFGYVYAKFPEPNYWKRYYLK